MKYLSKYLFLLSFLAFSCGSENKGTDATEARKEGHDIIKLSQEQIKSIGITTTFLESGAIEKTIRLNGKATVSPSHLVSISSILGGRVKSIKVLPGSHFKKGGLLAVIEDEQFVQLQQDYLITKAKLATARLDYERQKELNATKASSDKILQLAEAEFKTLDATQKALEEKLKLIHINPKLVNSESISSAVNITAPFDGTVSKIFCNTGQFLNSSDILMELIDNTGLLLTFKAFESNILNLEIGQQVLAYTNQNPDKKQKAKIVSIVPNIGSDGSADVIAKLDEASPAIIPGLYINASIILKNFKTQILPQESIVSFENVNYVFEDLGNDSYKLLMIKAGAGSNAMTEIIEAEKLQDKKIVCKGAYDLLMALKNKAEE